MSTFQLIYTSRETQKMTDQDLESILEASRRNNDRYGITGILVYERGQFIQVLEGHYDYVQDTYSKIIADRRHANVSILSNKYVGQREFGDWLMAFARLQNDGYHPDCFIDSRTIGEDLTLEGSDATQILHLFRNGLLAEGTPERLATGLASVRIGPSQRPQPGRDLSFLINFGRAVSLSVPDLPIEAILPDGKTVKFNSSGTLSAGDIELF